MNASTHLSSRLNIPDPASTTVRTSSGDSSPPSPPTDSTGVDDDEMINFIDPRLRGDTGDDGVAINASTMVIGNIVTGHKNKTEQNAVDIALPCDQLDDILSKELILPTQQFVAFFARINLVLSSYSNHSTIPSTVTGIIEKSRLVLQFPARIRSMVAS